MTEKVFSQRLTDSDDLADFVLLLGDLPYALIGGIAVNAYSKEAMPTMDADVCLREADIEPVCLLAKQHRFGVKKKRRYIELRRELSMFKIQIQTDPMYIALACKGRIRPVLGIHLKVAPKADVLAGKRAAEADPRRSEIKRAKDKLDILRLEKNLKGRRQHAKDSSERKRASIVKSRGIGVVS